MNIECSNLCEFTPNQLSLMIAGIDLKIQSNKDFMKETIRLGKDFVKLHKETIVRMTNDIEDLYAIRISLLTVYSAVRKQEQTISN